MLVAPRQYGRRGHSTDYRGATMRTSRAAVSIWALALICALLLAAVSLSATSASTQPVAAGRVSSSPQTQTAFQPRVEVVASNLEVPWALAFAPDGRLFFTERTGRLRVMVDGQLLPDPVATFPVASQPGNESGLLGLAIDPNFAGNGFIYVMYSYTGGQGQIANRISRLTVQGNQAGDETVLLDGIPGSPVHNGGRLKFGPAGKLFATTGDAGVANNAQDLNSLSGKILRLNPDGTIPDDNPFPGSPVFTFGHRNPEGLAFQLDAGQLFSSENGPTGHDELNVIDGGQNYGWPTVMGIAGNPNFVDPILDVSPSIAPSGATFYDGDILPGWTGNLFFGTLTGRAVRHIVLGGTVDSPQVAVDEQLFQGQFGRIRDVIQGPDGLLYFTTSNRDGRGNPSPDDDRILRIVP